MSPVIETLKPFARRADLSNSRWFGGNLFSSLATGSDTAGQFAIVEMRLMAGHEPPPHTHTIDDEAFYVLEGTIEYQVGTRTAIARAGDFVVLPVGIEHTFRVIGQSARALLITAPSGLEQAFHTLSDPATRMELRSEAADYDAAELTRVFGEVGLTFRSPNAVAPVTRQDPEMITRPALGRSIWFFGNLLTVLARGEQTNGQFSVMEFSGRRNQGPPPHVHAREDESFYLLEGTARVTVGETAYELNPGDFVFLPRGIPHCPELTSETGRALLIVTPAGFERYFEEYAEPARMLTIPPMPPLDSYDPAELARAGAKYGFEVMAPAAAK